VQRDLRGRAEVVSVDIEDTRAEIDLRQVAAHKLPSPMCLQIRLLRGRWVNYQLDGFRPAEITRLRSLLTKREHQNHLRHESEG
jgi:hypothetical protein